MNIHDLFSAQKPLPFPNRAASVEDEAVAESVRKDEQRKGKSEDRNAHTIFVGNLPKSILSSKSQRKALRTIFAAFGSVVSVRFPDSAKTDRNPAFAKIDEMKKSTNVYFVMSSEEEARRCLEANATVFEGRHIRVDLSTANPEIASKKSIFVGNIAFDIDEEHLWKLFEQCGKITSVRLVRDGKTSIGKGFGYVTFAEKPSTSLALQLNGALCQGRPIRILKCAKPELKRKSRDRKAAKPAPNKKSTPRKRLASEETPAPKRADNSKPKERTPGKREHRKE